MKIFYFLIFCQFLLTAGCSNPLGGNLSTSRVDPGYRPGLPSGSTFTTDWVFLSSAPYIFSPTKIQVSGSVATNLLINQTDNSNSVTTGFGAGTLSNVQWNGGSSWLELTAAGEVAGTGSFTSRIFDAGGVVAWNRLSWIPMFPYFKELPNSGTSEVAYASGNANMTNNLLLLHLNETAGATTFTDNSPSSLVINCATCPISGGTGKFNTSTAFDGATNLINLGANAALNFGASAPFTVEGWFNTAAIYGTIFSLRASADSTVLDVNVGFDGGTTNPGHIMGLVRQDGGATFAEVVGPLVNDGNWHHFCLTRNSGNQIELFLDGISLGTNTSAGAGGSITTDVRSVGAELYWITAAYGTAAQQHFLGSIDEISIYGRQFLIPEVLNHYKRGALRIKYQVRSCSNVTCAATAWQGPDGTAATYYSELNNSSLGLPSISITPTPANNQYFQYQVILETDNNTLTPQLPSVDIGPVHYDASSPSLTLSTTGKSFTSLNTFSEVLGGSNAGTVQYQISNNGSTWYFWNGVSWTSASGVGQSNTASVINSHIATFVSGVGTGIFYFQAFLISPLGVKVELQKVSLTGN